MTTAATTVAMTITAVPAVHPMSGTGDLAGVSEHSSNSSATV
jgi:hypothetical protein